MYRVRQQPSDLSQVKRGVTEVEHSTAALEDEYDAWELAFETKRWWDLVRRDSEEPGYWASTLSAHDPNATALHPLDPIYKRFPIPQGQIDVNPALRSCQNPGY